MEIEKPSMVDSSGGLCGKCWNLVRGKVCSAYGLKFHSECFLCNKCQTNIVPGFVFADQVFFCPTCAYQKFGTATPPPPPQSVTVSAPSSASSSPIASSSLSITEISPDTFDAPPDPPPSSNFPQHPAPSIPLDRTKIPQISESSAFSSSAQPDSRASLRLSDPLNRPTTAFRPPVAAASQPTLPVHTDPLATMSPRQRADGAPGRGGIVKREAPQSPQPSHHHAGNGPQAQGQTLGQGQGQGQGPGPVHCAGCSKPFAKAPNVVRIVAVQRNWHPHCFVCSVCHSDFHPDYDFVVVNGSPCHRSCSGSASSSPSLSNRSHQ